MYSWKVPKLPMIRVNLFYLFQRGYVGLEACPRLLQMVAAGNQTPDLQIKKPGQTLLKTRPPVPTE